jgi:hypothetical protein
MLQIYEFIKEKTGTSQYDIIKALLNTPKFVDKIKEMMEKQKTKKDKIEDDYVETYKEF